MAGVFRKDGKEWMIDTKVKVDGEYKHFTKRGYSTLSMAKADYEDAKAKFIHDNEKHHAELFFEDIIERHRQFRSRMVKESSLEQDNSTYNAYMLPYFKGMPIKKVFIQPVINNWYYDLF